LNISFSCLVDARRLSVEIVEIMVEGLRGFPTMTRIPLGNGVTMLAPTDGREAALIPVLLDLMFPKAMGEPILPELVDPNAPVSRAGLHVVGRDGTNYRLLRDLKSGKTSLLRQGAGGMEPVSSEANAIGQMMTAQIGFPQADILREVFFTRRSDLPSQQPDALEVSGLNQVAAPTSSEPRGGEARSDMRGEESGKNRAWNKPLPPGFAQAAPATSAFAALPMEEKKAKLAELRLQLSSFDGVKALEFELDGIQKSGFAIDEKLRPLDHLRRQLKENEDLLSRLAEYADVPPDLPTQAKRIAQQKAEMAVRLRDLEERATAYDTQLARELKHSKGARDLVRTALKDAFVVGGVVAGIVAILVAVIGKGVWEPLRYAALLDIPAFGVAVFGAFRFIGEAENSLRIKRQIELVGQDKEKLLNAFALEANNFKATLRRFNLDTRDMDEVSAGITHYRNALHAVEAARTTLEEALGGDDLQTLQAERDAISAKAKALEEDLYKRGGFLGNQDEIVAEISALEDAIAGRVVDVPLPQEEAPAPALAAPASTGMLATARQLARIVRHASDLMLTDLDTTMTTLAPRAAQYVGGLSDRRYAQVIFGPKGEVSVVDAATGRAIPFGMLTPVDRDIVYIALKCTIIEMGVKLQRVPVIFERAFETIPNVKDPLLVRMLQFLAQGTQVFVMTKKPGLAAIGGQRVALQ
jgi:hypothetical protein